jgi:NAD-reducing hydrogenase small subunit
MDKIKLATVWLAGCSGCHMSFLDLDEWLFELAAYADLVYSPIADVKAYPAAVDVCLVEGAVANQENLRMIHT